MASFRQKASSALEQIKKLDNILSNFNVEDCPFYPCGTCGNEACIFFPSRAKKKPPRLVSAGASGGGR